MTMPDEETLRARVEQACAGLDAGCAGALSQPVAVWVQQRQSLLTPLRVLWLPVVRQWSDVLGAAEAGGPAERFPNL